MQLQSFEFQALFSDVRRQLSDVQAQISQIQAQYSDLESRISHVQSQLSTQPDDVTKLWKIVSVLDVDAGERDKTVKAVQTRMAEYEKKTTTIERDITERFEALSPEVHGRDFTKSASGRSIYPELGRGRRGRDRSVAF
jgi:peptidoglycan hydrolase CwlO-like protein